ncbi:MAG: caspase family protein [Candidatus Nitricoxidivorans perseverans]|uniref:Caspase family protein n=1 Tax=Candidatus Nitricoxidivorans perseverans TaxID=2975601 RepID=A0AA49FK13_9PROT|nr:MAG: caspase family protein [Candidatus Nitricoxidivorans perseverans]
MRILASLALLAWSGMAAGQGFRPPAFFGGVPGMAQFQAIQMQRHQARTLLYREALEELRKNPAAADVPECPAGGAPAGTLCLARAETPPAPPQAPPARRRLAVLIGNNDYKNPIPELETPVADVGRTAEILKNRFGFEPRVLKNAGKAQIVEALNKIAAEATPEDSVLLFYAGHGYLMDDTKMGFWIPVDASVKTAAGWISNTDISRLLAAIKARQLILVSDSCFSGSLTKEQKIGAGGAANRDEVLRRRSVLVLSSGGDEPVSDEGKEGHSIFAWNLIKTLEAADGVTPGYEVYRQVRGRVMKDYPQEPQYGAVVSAGHASGGEYLFDAGAAAATTAR